MAEDISNRDAGNVNNNARASDNSGHSPRNQPRKDRSLFGKRPGPIQGIRDFVAKRRLSIDEVVRETTSGGIVFRRSADTNRIEILLIQDAKNRWTIPKGHVEVGEEPKQTAEREIREETGLQEMKVYNWLGKVNFRYRRTHTLVLMTMHIYLVHGLGDTNKLQGEDWLTDIKWFEATEAVDKIAYDDIGKLMLLGMKKIRDLKL
jgi:8-oxo-dGTP pyrophosphatase MutT (NUDIX family)